MYALHDGYTDDSPQILAWRHALIAALISIWIVLGFVDSWTLEKRVSTDAGVTEETYRLAS